MIHLIASIITIIVYNCGDGQFMLNCHNSQEEGLRCDTAGVFRQCVFQDADKDGDLDALICAPTMIDFEKNKCVKQEHRNVFIPTPLYTPESK